MQLGATVLAGAVSFLLRPVRLTWWRALWVGPVRFAKKLVFAALVSASDFDATGLPASVFVTLLYMCLLLLQA